MQAESLSLEITSLLNINHKLSKMMIKMKTNGIKRLRISEKYRQNSNQSPFFKEMANNLCAVIAIEAVIKEQSIIYAEIFSPKELIESNTTKSGLK